MRWTRASALAALLVVGVSTVWPAKADAVTRIFAGGIDKVWKTTRSVLDSEGWDIDEEDRVAGRIVTDPRNVNFRDFGVYGEGIRQRLTLTLRPAGTGRTAVTVERELFREERILWSRDRVPVASGDHKVELGILHGIGLFVAPAAPVATAPAVVVPTEKTTVAPSPALAAPAPSPATSARPEHPAPEAKAQPSAPEAKGQATAQVPKITYRVTGSGGTVQVTYRNAQGANDRQTASALPWELSFAGKGGAPLYLSAITQGTANASVTCEILVDGAPRSQSMSVGASVVATCSTPAP